MVRSDFGFCPKSVIVGYLPKQIKEEQMTTTLQPGCRAMLIGSQPVSEHKEAADLVSTYASEIPNWAQLPVFKQEGMVSQFESGLPGLIHVADKTFADTAGDHFDQEMVAFFEEYLAIAEQVKTLEESRFVLTPELAKGFFALQDALAEPPNNLFAVKGQITGPITFCMAMKDQDGRAIFYNDALRDAANKLLALKAAWQIKQLSKYGVPVIIFIDEPSLAGFGSSEFISVSKEDIAASLHEVTDTIHAHGGLAGVHVCANTDWSLLLAPEVDIVNFDAYGYFDKFILYADQIKTYLVQGGCLAWGLVPTLQPDEVAAITEDSLWQLWQTQMDQVGAAGIDIERLKRQTFITPSCGTGSLPVALSRKVLELTNALSLKIRGINNKE